MKSRLIVACIFIPILFVIFVLLPSEATMIFVSLVAAMGVYELLRPINEKIGFRVIVYSVLTSFAVCAWRCIDKPIVSKLFYVWAFLFIFVVFCDFMFSSRSNKGGFPEIAVVILGAFAIPFALSSLSMLRSEVGGNILILVPFVAAFTSDGGAYFAGMAFGKHKLAPSISPKKTIEGSVGGFVSAAVCMLIFGLVTDLATKYSVSYVAMLVYGIISSAVAQIGDLAFSYIKRGYDIKDYGQLLPGHGGILDRFDSIIFIAPLTEVVLTFIALLK